MADVFRAVNGRKLTKIIALHETVQHRLDDIVLERAVVAEAILRSHEHTGASRITVEEGKIDRYVVLDDTRGQEAAMSIEYGRKIKDEHGNVVGRTTPVRALHDAFGLGDRQ